MGFGLSKLSDTTAAGNGGIRWQDMITLDFLARGVKQIFHLWSLPTEQAVFLP